MLYLNRITGCRYERIGCNWRGPFHELQGHEADCTHPKKTGSELIEAITAIDAKSYGEMTLFRNIFDLLSFQKIAQSGNSFMSKWYQIDIG